jgi:excinuclease ABC subunit C
MPETKEQIKNLPDATGVYILKDKNGKIFYIGKSTSIKKRVQTHQNTRFSGKISKIEFIETGSELDALLLEAKLIKKYMPQYNVVMRDDKSFPYIKITKEDFPRVLLARKLESDGAEYFGPFMGGSVREILKIASRVFKVRRCRQSPLKERIQPCLDYYIKRCEGPCIKKIGKQAYSRDIKGLEDFLNNGVERTARKIKKEMEAAAKTQKFEKAAILRNRLQWLARASNPRISSMIESSENKKTLEDLQKDIGLDKIPERIEAFDISNTGPSETVASMVVFMAGIPLKKDYRKFKIRLKDTPNDVAAIYEVVLRRYSKSLAKTLPLPDLILIDGGQGQLNSAVSALQEAKEENIPAISLAKRLEEIFVAGKKDPVILPRSSESLRLLQKIRDEAHRFAVSFHRKRRQESIFSAVDKASRDAKLI